MRLIGKQEYEFIHSLFYIFVNRLVLNGLSMVVNGIFSFEFFIIKAICQCLESNLSFSSIIGKKFHIFIVRNFFLTIYFLIFHIITLLSRKWFSSHNDALVTLLVCISETIRLLKKWFNMALRRFDSCN